MLLDIEGITNATRPARDALSHGLCALRAALEKAIPGSHSGR